MTTPAAIARRLELLVADADEAITAGREPAWALGFLMGKLDQVIEHLDSDPTPPHGIERPTYHEPMPLVSTQREQTTDNDGNIWWTEHRLPKQGEQFVHDGVISTAGRDHKVVPHAVILGGPL